MSLPAIEKCLRCGGPLEPRGRGGHCWECELDFEVQEPDIILCSGADLPDNYLPLLKPPEMETITIMRGGIYERLDGELLHTVLDWYEKFREIGCPHCGIDFKKMLMLPGPNLLPHLTGACAETPKAPTVDPGP